MEQLYQEQEPVSRPAYYAVIPADVRYDDQLPANAKLLYGEISALIGADGFCFAGNQYFADIYRCTPESIARLITKLEKAGYIHRELDRDKSGQIVRRKIYLKVSAPDTQPLNNIVTTSQQNCGEGIDKNVKDTNTSITNIEKENKKEKPKRERRTAMTDEQLWETCRDWVANIAPESWTGKTKNTLYQTLIGFYAPRENRKKEPGRTYASLTALTNRLLRFSNGDPAVMIDMLERATTAGWRSVYPIGGDRQTQPEARKDEVWL